MQNFPLPASPKLRRIFTRLDAMSFEMYEASWHRMFGYSTGSWGCAMQVVSLLNGRRIFFKPFLPLSQVFPFELMVGAWVDPSAANDLRRLLHNKILVDRMCVYLAAQQQELYLLSLFFVSMSVPINIHYGFSTISSGLH
jgi:hypothetical protein